MKVLFTPFQLQNSKYINAGFNYEPTPIKYCSYPTDSVSFSGKTAMKRSLDINLDIKKLSRQIDEILKSGGNISYEERIYQAYDRMVRHKQYMVMEVDELEEEMLKHLNRQDKFSEGYMFKTSALFSRYKDLKKQEKFRIVVKKPTEEEIKTDYKLLNLFKIALSNEHFNLKKVYDNYYKGLNNIKTIDELTEKYPKLIPPEKPEDIISDKILKFLTRDHYEYLNELMINKDSRAVLNFIYKIVYESHDDKLFGKLGVSPSRYDSLVAPVFSKKLLRQYLELFETDSFASIPTTRKEKSAKLSEVELKLLKVDYEDYVLSVFKDLYINGKKPNDIKYSDGNVSIKLTELKDKYYKFDKVSEKIKSFISKSLEIQKAQREYEKFSPEELMERISYYSDKIDNDAEILDKMIDFISCRFHEEDRPMLIKFLQELDEVWDGNKTIKEATESIKYQNLRPIGTEKINAAERNAAILQKQEEYKRFAELALKQSEFDQAMNTLFQNNMNYAAELCSQYRPQNLDSGSIGDAKFIIDLINKSKITPNKDIISNKEKLTALISRWDIYTSYLKTKEQTKLFKSAQDFATGRDGKIDINEAGKYLINSEIIRDYPATGEYYKNPKILDKIIELCQNDKEAAIKYLCKYDSYTDLENTEKYVLSNYIDIFDIKDSVSKAILKQIIENDYITHNTKTVANINVAGVKTVEAQITAKAKEELYNYYKYPECLDLFKAFEEALGNKASSRGAAGIKKLYSEPYQFELKIMGYPDRLLAKDRQLIFDTHSKQGLL